MPAVSRVGDVCAPFVTVPIIVTGSPNVFVNGQPVARQGDFTATFKKRQGRKIKIFVSQLLIPPGSPTVFVNGKLIAKIGTLGTNDTVVVTGSTNVFTS